jgi:hypothetical protein
MSQSGGLSRVTSAMASESAAPRTKRANPESHAERRRSWFFFAFFGVPKAQKKSDWSFFLRMTGLTCGRCAEFCSVHAELCRINAKTPHRRMQPLAVRTSPSLVWLLVAIASVALVLAAADAATAQHHSDGETGSSLRGSIFDHGGQPRVLILSQVIPFPRITI